MVSGVPYFLCRSVDVASREYDSLTIFSMISGVSINLSKSIVLGIGIDSEFATNIANDLHCRYGVLLLNYLGLPLGGRVVNCGSWNHVVELFRFRLAHCGNLSTSP